MARNKTSRFGADEGLFVEDFQPVQVKEEPEEQVQEQAIAETKIEEKIIEPTIEPEVEDEAPVIIKSEESAPEAEKTEYRPVQTNNHFELRRRPFGSTQGRKGQKAKRINMAFSDENYEFIKTKSNELGCTATELVNQIIYDYSLNM